MSRHNHTQVCTLKDGSKLRWHTHRPAHFGGLAQGRLETHGEPTATTSKVYELNTVARMRRWVRVNQPDSGYPPRYKRLA